MWGGMQRMHGNQSSMHGNASVNSIQKFYESDKFVLSLNIPPLYLNVNSKIDFKVEFKSKSTFEDSPRFLISIHESGINVSENIEIDAEGTFPINFTPQTAGLANVSIKLIKGELQNTLIETNQMVMTNHGSTSIFSNSNTYIIGGLFMGAMMTFMLFGHWM
jgi:hypothetical protein